MVSSFKELNVYQRSYSLALEIHKATLGFPKIEQFALAAQMRRASKSICANLAEGFAKNDKSTVEFKRFAQISLGSSDEMTVWIDFCKDLGYISTEISTKWSQEYKEISKMLNGLSKNWKENE